MRPTTGKQQGSKNKSSIPHPLTPTRDLRNVGGDYHAGLIRFRGKADITPAAATRSARALYLGGTEYRIHGTNDPTTFGRQVRLSAYLQNTNERVRRQQAAAFAPFVVPE